jgi:hypothetical protein
MFFKSLRLVLVGALLTVFLAACGQAPPPTTPRPLLDRDGDGHAAITNGGRDCNDNDAKIGPNQKEDITDKIDNNCNEQIDEFTLDNGQWVLQTPAQATARWNIDIRTDSSSGKQYVRCLQFKFKIKSSVKNVIYNMTQWQSRMPSSEIPVINNKFKWVYDKPNDTLKTTFEGTFTSERTVTGTLTIRDNDPNVQAGVTLPFSGTVVGVPSQDKTTQEFCERCYDDPTCPAE